MDQIDKAIEQWRLVRPDLDVDIMVKRIHALDEQAFCAHGLNLAGFDVLTTLRRSGAPYALSIGDLLNEMIVTSGTMTNRIDQLEKAGLVCRSCDPSDARRYIVCLTTAGLECVDKAIETYIATQHQILAAFTQEEWAHLDRLLHKLTCSLGV